MASLAPFFNQQFFDSAGLPVAAGRLHTYDSGTTTPKQTWQDQAGTVTHALPTAGVALSGITLDAAGRLPGTGAMWLGTGEYTFHLYTSAGVLVKSWDDVGGQTSLADLIGQTAATGASLVYYSPAVAYAAGIGQFLNYLHARTAEEIAASITPTNYAYFPGDVRRYGALGGGVNDAAAVQAAYDSTHTVYFPFICTVTSTITLKTHGQQTVGKGIWISGLACSTAGVNLFTVGASGSVTRKSFSGVWLSCGATAGHVFHQAFEASQWSFDRVRVTQSNTAKSLWNGNGKIYIDNHWTNFEMQHALSSTVPGFNFVDATGGLVNSNSWKRGRCTYAGAYFFYIENGAAAQYTYDNAFENINFEVCLGGAIRGRGVDNLSVKNIYNYDMNSVGSSTRDWVSIGASTNGAPLKSRHITIKNVFRRAGSLGVGLADIKLETNGADTVLIEGGDDSSLAGFTVDVNSNVNVTIVNPRSSTISNKSTSTIIIGTAFAGMAFNLQEVFASGGNPEASVTANLGSIMMRNEGGYGNSAYVKENGTGNTGWSPVVTNRVSANKGDAAATLTVGSSEQTNVWSSVITADRAVTLSTTGAHNGAKFRIVRAATATGAFNLNVGTGPLKAMGTAGSYCDVEYNGSAWVLTGYGAF